MSGLVLPTGGRGVGGTCHVGCQDKYCRQGVGLLEALVMKDVRTSTAGRG